MSNYVILGGTGGIGSALCRQLAEDGAQLYVGARDETKLAALAEETGAQTLALDATNFAQVDDFFAKAKASLGRIDGAACCVGSLILKPAHTTSEAEWMQTVAQNLTAAFTTVRGAARTMTGNPDGGSIALVSSVASRIGLSNHEAIAAAKGGINGLTLSAAATYARSKIRVNAVAPGLVRTPLADPLTANEVMLKASTQMHPLGRIGEPEDVASLLAWLLNPANSWITGQIIGADGGLGSVKAR